MGISLAGIIMLCLIAYLPLRAIEFVITYLINHLHWSWT